MWGTPAALAPPLVFPNPFGLSLSKPCPSYFFAGGKKKKKGQGFDKLSPNGVG